MFDNPFGKVGDPGQCVDATVQSSNSWKALVVPTHTIHPRPAAMCEEQHEDQEPTRTMRTFAAVAHPSAQQDAFPSDRIGNHQVHTYRASWTCMLLFFPNMTKRTLIKTEKAHANIFILETSRFITSPIRKIGFRVLWGFQEKPNPVFDMLHVWPCFGVPTFFSMHVQPQLFEKHRSISISFFVVELRSTLATQNDPPHHVP